MVRKYIKKTDRQAWSKDAMNKAVDAIKTRKIGYLKAAKEFGVPKTTLERYVRKLKKNPGYRIEKKMGRLRQVFTEEQELELVNYLRTMEAWLFYPTVTDLRSFAFQMVARNGLISRYKTWNAGDEWLKGFMHRHPTLSVHRHQTKYGEKANRRAEANFIVSLKSLIGGYGLTESRIFSCDEIEISVKPFISEVKEKCPALEHEMESEEQAEETVVGVVCMSASGAFMPPMLSFPAEEKREQFELGLPEGGWSEVHGDREWIAAESFLEWMRRFVSFSRASKTSPVVLILDAGMRHTKNLEVIDFAQQNGVCLVCLPPFGTRKLQPLAVAFLRTLSREYAQEFEKRLLRNFGTLDFTLDHVSKLFGIAFEKIAKEETAIDGFRTTGIWPTDPSLFTNASVPAFSNGAADAKGTVDPDLAYQLTLPSQPGSPIQFMPVRLDSDVSANCDEGLPGEDFICKVVVEPLLNEIASKPRRGRPKKQSV